MRRLVHFTSRENSIGTPCADMLKHDREAVRAFFAGAISRPPDIGKQPGEEGMAAA